MAIDPRLPASRLAAALEGDRDDAAALRHQRVASRTPTRNARACELNASSNFSSEISSGGS
jgi:hypothetical protein